jgi:hypothetical protein
MNTISHLRQTSLYLLEDIAFFQLKSSALALKEALARHCKYDPDQPRVPAGNSDGGQWTSEGDGERHPNSDLSVTWRRSQTLDTHYKKHGKNLNVTSAEDYAHQASEFRTRAQNEKLPAVVDKDGVTRYYDPKTNTFGSYNPDGTTRTYYKPEEGQEYFRRQMEKDVAKGGTIIHPLPPQPTDSGEGRNRGRGGGEGGGGPGGLGAPDHWYGPFDIPKL